MKLRDYQLSCLNAITNIFKDSYKTNKYIVMPTGTGKTEVFKNISKKRVLVLENRSDLRDQIGGRYNKDGVDTLIIGGGKHLTQTELNNSSSKVVIATVQTIAKDIYNIEKDSFDLIIIDEFQDTKNDLRYKTILDNLTYKLCLGFSATPPETSTVFDLNDKLYEMTIFEAWRDGWLMKPECYHLELAWDKQKLTNALKSGGIWRDEDIEAAFIEYSENNFNLILTELKTLNNCEKSVVYFSTKKLADSFTQFCVARGYNCYTYTSDTKPHERKKILQNFENMRQIILSNVYCLTKGIDLPSMECIILARPVNDVNDYKQICGRVLRLAPNKNTCKICDCIVDQNNSLFQHTFITAYCIPFQSDVKIDTDFYKDLVKDLNNAKDIEKFANDLSDEFGICYNLFKDDKIYCDNYEIPYTMNDEKTKLYIKGVAYDKKYNIYTNDYTIDYDKVRFKIYAYINLLDNTLHLSLLDNTLHLSRKAAPHIIQCKSTEDCFKWLSDTYCKYDNIFKNNAYTKKKGIAGCSIKQKNLILNLTEKGFNVSRQVAEVVCNKLSKKEASSIIDKLILITEINKILERESNEGEK